MIVPRIYDKNKICTETQLLPLEVHLGAGLLPLVDKSNFKDEEPHLLSEITQIRTRLDDEYGVPIPLIRFCDDIKLKEYEYKIIFNGIDVGGFKNLKLDYVLCLNSGNVTEELQGEKVKDPIFGGDGILVPNVKSDEAKNLGYKVMEPFCIISTHLFEFIKINLSNILDQSIVNTLINRVRKTNPDVVDYVIFMHNLSTSWLKQVLSNLLKDGFSIRYLNKILEVIADNIDETRDFEKLLERIRLLLAWQFLPKFADEDKIIHVISISDRLSKILTNRISYSNSENIWIRFSLSSLEMKAFENKIWEKAISMQEKGYRPIFKINGCLRIPLLKTIRQTGANWTCITDKEFSLATNVSFVIEEELEVEEIKDNE
jgi:flagellar biosynthesis protein FlhA